MKPLVAGLLGALVGAGLAALGVLGFGLVTGAINVHSGASESVRVVFLLLAIFGIPVAGLLTGFNFARRSRKQQDVRNA